MINNDGSQNTSHTINPVPVIVVNSDKIEISNGILADIAPTILEIMDINKPIEMSGELDLSSMVGKVVMGKVDDWRKKPMNMRKIEL